MEPESQVSACQVSGIRAGAAGDFDEVSRIVTGLEPSRYSLVHRNVESVAAWWECLVLVSLFSGTFCAKVASGMRPGNRGPWQSQCALVLCWYRVGLSKGGCRLSL